MFFTVIAGMTHAIIGACLGVFFRIPILILAMLLSVAAMIGIGVTTGTAILWPIVISELALQVGYGVGSFIVSLLAARTASCHESSTDSRSQELLASIRRFGELK